MFLSQSVCEVLDILLSGVLWVIAALMEYLWVEDETTPLEKVPVTLQKLRTGWLDRSEQLTQEKLLEPRGWGRSMIVVSLKVVYPPFWSCSGIRVSSASCIIDKKSNVEMLHSINGGLCNIRAWPRKVAVEIVEEQKEGGERKWATVPKHHV